MWAPWIERLRNPVRLFDAAGLALFAVVGANKALAFGLNPLMAPLLGMLSGIDIVDVDTAIAAAAALARPIVVVTSVPVEDELGTLLATRDRALLATTPRIAAPPHGAGDLFTALLFGHMVAGAAVDTALQSAVRSTYHILARSDGAPEMALIAEQKALVEPPDLIGFALTNIDLRRRAHG